MSQTANAGKLPEGTETEEWRVMSAQVAWALWKAKQAPKSDWEANAARYRARTRYVLRQLELEGPRLRMAGDAPVLPANTDAWRQASARLAWLLWLRERRELLAADKQVEAMMWKLVADDERKRIRTVLVGLDAEGVRFLR